MAQAIKRIEAILPDYDLALCDVWGVIHNGIHAWSQAYRALMRARDAGVQVVLITNAPRPFKQVREQLDTLGVPSQAYDAIVTSGDVTRALIKQHDNQIFYIGPDRDRAIFDGMDIEYVTEEQAAVIVCTGLLDDSTEKPEDYTVQLKRLRKRNLPFICANPDIVVEKGDHLIWCAGALARDYKALGGKTRIAGKPHRPIYEEAIRQAESLKGTAIDRTRILAIGDGMPTDVKGAINNNIDLLFISDGIHSREYGSHGNPDLERLNAFLEQHGASPIATMTKLA